MGGATTIDRQVVIQAVAPAAPTTRMVWWDTTTDELWRWDGAAWVPLTAGTTINFGVLPPAGPVNNTIWWSTGTNELYRYNAVAARWEQANGGTPVGEVPA